MFDGHYQSKGHDGGNNSCEHSTERNLSTSIRYNLDGVIKAETSSLVPDVRQRGRRNIVKVNSPRRFRSSKKCKSNFIIDTSKMTF